MKTATAVHNKIFASPAGTLWSFDDFKDLPFPLVAKTLSRMSKSGQLRRIHKGIYYYPKKTALGESVPSTDDVLSKLFHDTKDLASVSGTAAFHQLGLTNQVPSQVVFISPKRSRTLHIGNATIKIKHQLCDHLSTASKNELLILDALKNIKRIPDKTFDESIDGIIKFIVDSDISLKHLIRFSMHEPPRVRALVGALASDLGYKGKDLLVLKQSINSLSKFKFGAVKRLRYAKEWQIG